MWQPIACKHTEMQAKGLKWFFFTITYKQIAISRTETGWMIITWSTTNTFKNIILFPKRQKKKVKCKIKSVKDAVAQQNSVLMN